jgi:Ca2+-binding EF-hand superfamily protein
MEENDHLREEIEELRAMIENLDSEKPGNIEINHLLRELTGTEPDNYSDSPLQQRAMDTAPLGYSTVR